MYRYSYARNGAIAVDGDLLGARSGEAGGIAATEVVRLDGVVPEGLDGGIAVVGSLHRNGEPKQLSLQHTKLSYAQDTAGNAPRYG